MRRMPIGNLSVFIRVHPSRPGGIRGKNPLNCIVPAWGEGFCGSLEKSLAVTTRLPLRNPEKDHKLSPLPKGEG